MIENPMSLGDFEFEQSEFRRIVVLEVYSLKVGELHDLTS